MLTLPQAYWLLLIVAGATNAGLTVYMPETYAPRILHQKAKRMRKATGKTDLHALLNRKMSTRRILAHSFTRPIKVVLRTPDPHVCRAGR